MTANRPQIVMSPRSRPGTSTAPGRPLLVMLIALLLFGLIGIGSGDAIAANAANAAQDEARLKQLSDELRCMVCQNQTLSDSNAELAVDLRNQVKRLIDQGMSNDEIKAYLVERYGQFVLYKPMVQRSTLLLWGGPFVLLLGGLLIWWRLGRRTPQRTGTPPGGAGAIDGNTASLPSAATADSSREAARRLLDDH